MVSYTLVQSSNARIASSLPAGLVAVFVGATSGIGEYTLKAFAKRTVRPRVYFVGRSEKAGTRITAECKDLNPEGEFTFVQSELSELKKVDEVCRRLKTELDVIDLLWLSQGVLSVIKTTDEDLPYAIALAYYGRHRFAQNLLPLIQKSTSLRRVVSCLAGGKDGPINTDDLDLKLARSPMKARGHLVSMITFSLEQLAKQAPDVSFVHNFPGPVRTNIARDNTAINIVARSLFFFMGPFVYMAEAECGERHLFLCTSAKYAAKNQTGATYVSLEKGVEVARGSDGQVGSGVYLPDQYGESAPASCEAILKEMRDNGVKDKVWKHAEEQFARILGSANAI